MDVFEDDNSVHSDIINNVKEYEDLEIKEILSDCGYSN